MTEARTADPSNGSGPGPSKRASTEPGGIAMDGRNGAAGRRRWNGEAVVGPALVLLMLFALLFL